MTDQTKDRTVLVAMMRKLASFHNLFAYKVMGGVLAEHGLYHDSESGEIREYGKTYTNEVASLEGPGEGNPERRTNSIKYRVTYNQADAEHALFEDAKRRAGAPAARLLGVQTFNESAATIRAFVDMEVDDD